MTVIRFLRTLLCTINQYDNCNYIHSTIFTSLLPLYRFPRLWNELNPNLHNIISINKFKRKVNAQQVDLYAQQCANRRCRQCFPNNNMICVINLYVYLVNKTFLERRFNIRDQLSESCFIILFYFTGGIGRQPFSVKYRQQHLAAMSWYVVGNMFQHQRLHAESKNC